MTFLMQNSFNHIAAGKIIMMEVRRLNISSPQSLDKITVMTETCKNLNSRDA